MLTLVGRRWEAAAVSAIAALTLITVVIARAIADRQPSPGDLQLRVLSSNLLAGGADGGADRILRQARRVLAAYRRSFAVGSCDAVLVLLPC
ncbi:MAG TPA: hypothetical protein VFB74_22490 [Kribbellaceae bacterium]|nr:hypothetical protein [Kribbellaceae bacterium]